MRVRRHLQPKKKASSAPSKGLLYGVLWVALAAVLGYLVTVIWLYPAAGAGTERAAPRVLGLPRTQAVQLLAEEGFRGRVTETEPHSTVPPGSVIWQDPPAGVSLEPGAVVALSLSTGPPSYPIPDVAGLGSTLAQAVLEGAGFRVTRFDSIAAHSEPGTAVATRPQAGVARPPGTPLTLVVSRGPANIPVPNLLGLTHTEAWERVEAVGLRIGRVTTRPEPDSERGRIIDQRPAAGTLAPTGGRINIVFARTTRP